MALGMPHKVNIHLKEQIISITTQALHFQKHLLLSENSFAQSQLHFSFFHLLYSLIRE